LSAKTESLGQNNDP